MLFRVFRPVLVALVVALVSSRSVATEPEDVLPDETLAFVSLSNAADFRTLLTNAPQTAYWRDPAMQAFRDHARDALQREFLQPLIDGVGPELADLAELIEGRATLAVLQEGWSGESNSLPACVFFADVGDATNKLTKKLRFMTKGWEDAGRPFLTNVVQGAPFYTWQVAAPTNSWLRSVVPITETTNGASISLHLGQSGSLVVLSTSLTAIEAIVRRQSEPHPATLSANPRFASVRTNLFGASMLEGWVDPTRILPPLLKAAVDREWAIQPRTLARFLGLDSIQHVAFAVHADDSGTLLDIDVAAPAARRTGLLKFGVMTNLVSSPPEIVPVNALSESRFRIDLKAFLSGIETFVVDAEPAASGAIRLILETAGKDEDPGYDLRSQLLDNLGDDLVVFQPAPSTNSVESLLFPSKVVLIGSPASGRLANAVRVLANTLSPVPGSVSFRQVGDARIYRLKLGMEEGDDGGFSFAPVAGYVAFSSEEPLLEALLKGSEAHSLKDLSELQILSGKVGGMNSGWFSYQNRRETLRLQLAGVQMLPDGPVDLTIFGRLWMLLNSDASADTALFDYKLHPPFDAVKQYLGASAASGRFNEDGFRFKAFTPVPVKSPENH